MKKIILSAVVAAAAIFGAYTANKTDEVAMSDLQVENVEALGDGGSDGGNGWKCHDSIQEYQAPEDRNGIGLKAGFTGSTTIYTGFDCMCDKIKYISVKKRCK